MPFLNISQMIMSEFHHIADASEGCDQRRLMTQSGHPSEQYVFPNELEYAAVLVVSGSNDCVIAQLLERRLAQTEFVHFVLDALHPHV